MGNHQMMKFLLIATTMCSVLLSGTAFASEAEDMAAGIKCFPAKKIVKMVRKFDGMKPEKKDTVGVIPEMQLTASEGESLPERVYFREGSTEEAFILGADGWVTDFNRIGSMSKGGELCMQGKQFAGKKDEELGINLSMDFDILFKNTSGRHTIAELLDGAKDGKSHYKKMLPGVMALMVPKMTHVGVTYLSPADSTQPRIYAVKSGDEIGGLFVEKFHEMYVVGLEDLQALSAENLNIEGGEYHLTPIPSIKKMKKLGFGGGGNENTTEN